MAYHKSAFTGIEVLLVVILLAALVLIGMMVFGNNEDGRASLFFEPSHELYRSEK